MAIAASWIGTDEVECWALDRDEPEDMLAWFRDLWDEADLATGHHIAGFDIPIVNAALMEHGLPMLTQKLTCDTKRDLRRFAGISKSQENLALMLHTHEEKYHMADNDWRGIARLEPEAMAECRRRVIEDVRQHIALRAALLEAGALRAPRTWKP